MIWIAIVTLAKDKIKKKIKEFLNPDLSKMTYKPSNILNNIQKEYNNLQSTLSMNIISVKDELSRKIFSKNKKKRKQIKKDIIEEESYEKINMIEVFKKAITILKKLVLDIIQLIKSYIV